MSLNLSDWNTTNFLTDLPPALLSRLLKTLMDTAEAPCHLFDWQRPGDVWVEMLRAARAVLAADEASDSVLGLAQAVLDASNNVRARLLVGFGTAEGAYPYWAMRAALGGWEARYGALPAVALAVDAECAEGRSPLQEVLWDGNFEAAEFLLDRGADPNFKDREGFTPLMVAASYSLAGTVEDAPLQDDALPVVRRLLAMGADVECRHCCGGTALTGAVRAGFAEAARLLLEAGADPTAGEPGHRAIDHLENVAEHADLVEALSASR